MKTKLIFLALLIFCTTYSSAQIRISIHDSTFTIGDTLNIPIYADSMLTDQNILAYKLQLMYDSNILRIISVSANATLSQGMNVSYNNQLSDKIDIAAAGTIPLTSNGILLFIKVAAINSGNMYLIFTDTLNNYFNEGSPAISFRNGYFKVLPRPTLSIYPSSGILTVGEEMVFTANSGQSPYSWSVTNPSSASINSSGILTGLKSGFIKVIARDAAGIIDSTTGTIEIRSFGLKIRDSSFYTGQTVVIPIYVSDLSGLGIYSGQFNLSFNHYILTPINIINIGTLTQNYMVPAFNYDGNGNMSIAFAGSSALSGSGIMMYIEFQISPIYNGNCGLSFSNIVFNQNLPGNFANGNLNIINSSSLSIYPTTASAASGDTLRFEVYNGTPPYKWAVSDTGLAKIDKTGLLSVIKTGTVIVTATDFYGANGNTGNISLFDTKVSLSDVSGNSGKTVDLDVIIGNLSSSLSIYSFQAEISFDSSIVKFNQIVSSGTSTNGWSFSVNNKGNSIVLDAASAYSLKNPGTLFKVRFNISANTNSGIYSPVYLQQFLFNEGTPSSLTLDGSITVTTSNPPGWANLQYPGNAVIFKGDSVTVFARIWIDGVTNLSGQGAGVTTWIGYNTTNVNPNLWTNWIPAMYNTDAGNNDEYKGTFGRMLPKGTYYYASRFLYNGIFYYGGFSTSGGGFWDGITYNSGELFINANPITAPTNLIATNIKIYKVNLAWVDNSNNENNFVVERTTDTTGSSGWETIVTLPSNSQTFQDSTVSVNVWYRWRVKAINADTSSSYAVSASLFILPLMSAGTENKPVEYSISQNYPNPFNPSTIIKYSIPFESYVIIKFYNCLGESVREVDAGTRGPGYYRLSFNASGLSSGIYFYTIQANSIDGKQNFKNTKKMILMK